MELSDRSPGCVPTPQGDGAMNPPDEFLKHAADCEQMAKFARDAESKATWKRMAERWRRCAEKFTSESLAAHQAMWPAPGSEDTELGVLMELEVGHGETEVYARVQA